MSKKKITYIPGHLPNQCPYCGDIVPSVALHLFSCKVNEEIKDNKSKQEINKQENKEQEYLKSKGWRLADRRRMKNGGFCHLWDHLFHQHDSNGFFLQSEALEHQKKYDKNLTCDCYPVTGKR